MVFRHWTAGAQDSAPERERRREGRAVTACCQEFPGSWNSLEEGPGRSYWSPWYEGEELAVPQAWGPQGLPGRAQERRAAERAPDTPASQLRRKATVWGRGISTGLAQARPGRVPSSESLGGTRR